MSLEEILKAHRSPSSYELHLDKILAELAAALPPGKTVDVDGTTYTLEELTKKVQAYKASFATPRELRAAFRAAVRERKKVTPELATFLVDLRAGLTGALGRKSLALEKMGFPPRKKPEAPTSVELLRRVEKARATREANGT